MRCVVELDDVCGGVRCVVELDDYTFKGSFTIIDIYESIHSVR